MRDHVFSLDAALVAATLFASPAIQADMYKWTAQDGTVTYSNQLPADRSLVKDFIRIEDIASAPSEIRSTPQAVEGEKRSSDSAVAKPAAAQPDPAPRAATKGVQTEAVQDPCLRSADPQCYEKNRDKYHPYLGYAPGTARPAPVGATSAAGAGGTVGGRASGKP